MPNGRQRAGRRTGQANRDERFPWYHAFVSHAGEHKQAVAYPIRKRLQEQHPNISVFVDEESLRIGDDALVHMHAALQTCDTAVVVLSPEYIRKRYPMWELHILLRRVRQGEAGLLVVLHNGTGTSCLEELASQDAPCYSDEFWGRGEIEQGMLKAPDAQEVALLQQWARDPTSLEGCDLIRPDQWTTTDELAALVEARVADLLHDRGQLPPRMEIFPTIPPPQWPDLKVRKEEALQAEEALLKHRYVELRGGPGEGKSTLAQYLTERLCAAWQRSPPDGAVGKLCHALEVDLRGLDEGASVKEAVASQVLAAARVVGYRPAQHTPDGAVEGLHSGQQHAAADQWLEFMNWALRQAPCPLLLLLENAEDAMHHEDLPEVLARLRALRHVHLIVATRAQPTPSLQADAPAEGCFVDLAVLDAEGGLQVMEMHLFRKLQAGAEQEAASKLVQEVQANPFFCGVAACLVNQAGRTWQELLELCAQDKALMQPADGRAGGTRRRLTLLQRWLGRALRPEEQSFLAHIAVFPESFTEAGAAAMQPPTLHVAGQQGQEVQQEQLAVSITAQEQQQLDVSFTVHDKQLVMAISLRQQLPLTVGITTTAGQQQQKQQHPVHMSAEQTAGAKPSSSSICAKEVLEQLRLLSLVRQLPTGHAPTTYTMGSRWLMHALVQQAATKLLHGGNKPGHSQAVSAEPPHDEGAPQPTTVPAGAQLDARFTEWMLWHPDGPGQALVACAPKQGDRPDAGLLWYLLAVEQGNLQAAAKKLLVIDVAGFWQFWQGRLGVEQVSKVDSVGWVLTDTGHHTAALQLRRSIAAAVTTSLGARHPVAFGVQDSLATTLRMMGQLGEARQLQEVVLAALTQLLGPEHYATLAVKSNLALTMQDMGQLGEARQLTEEVLASRTQVLGPEHPHTLDVRSNLANTMYKMGQLGEAQQLQDEVVAAMTQVLGPEHPAALSVKSSLARTLHAMGRLGEAQQLQEQVVAARTQLLGPEHRDTLSAKSNLATTMSAMGQLGEVGQLQEEVLAASTQLLGPEHPDTLAAKSNLADTMWAMGQLGEARQLQDEVVAAMTQVLGPEHPATFSAKSSLARTLHAMGRLGETQQLQEEAVAIRTQQLGPEHPVTLSAKSKLATTLRHTGQLGEARQLQDEVLVAMIQVLGPEHPDTLSAKSDLAITMRAKGQLGEARQLQDEVLAAMIQVLGPEHPGILSVKSDLTITMHAMGQLSEARQLQDEVLAAMSQLLGPEHLATLCVKSILAVIMHAMGQLGEARQLQDEVLAAMIQALGPEHPDTISVKSNLAITMHAMRQLVEARQLQEEVVAARTQLLGPEHPETLSAKNDLATTVQEMGQPGVARQLQDEVLAARTQLLGPEHPDTLTAKSNLGNTLQEMGQLGEARQLQDEVLAARTQLLGPEHPATLSVKSSLARTLHAMGRLGEAQQLQEEVVADMTRLLGPKHLTTLSVKSNLANTMHAMGQLGAARQLQEEVMAARTQLLGPEHPDTLSAKSNLATTLQHMGQLGAAR